MAGCFPQYSRVRSSAWGRGVRRGLTLLELLIVIVILAVLATVAVRSLTPLADQARYETTMRTMENVRSAVVGNSDTRQVNATPMVSGFIADMGRRPVTRGTDAAAWLSELWQSPTFAGDAPYSFAVRAGPSVVSFPAQGMYPAFALNCSDVSLACGWRGPYLQVPVNQNDVRDAWGTPFTLLDAGGDPIAAIGQSVERIRWDGHAPFAEPAIVELDQGLASLAVSVELIGGTLDRVSMVLLEPNSPIAATDSVPTELKATQHDLTYATPSATASHIFSGVSVGQRAVKVRIEGDRNGTPLTLERVQYVVIPHGGTSLTISVPE